MTALWEAAKWFLQFVEHRAGFYKTTKLCNLGSGGREAAERAAELLPSSIGAADSLTRGATPGWRMARGRKRAPLSGRIILQQPIQTGQIFIELYWI